MNTDLFKYNVASFLDSYGATVKPKFWEAFDSVADDSYKASILIISALENTVGCDDMDIAAVHSLITETLAGNKL